MANSDPVNRVVQTGPKVGVEALVMGRVGADLYPVQAQTALKDVRDFRRFVGGFAANVATGLVRLGVRVAIVSAVGSDGHGEFIRQFLEREGVDTRLLSTDPNWLTPLSFCELWPPDDFPITYYRQPTAPDWEIALDDTSLGDFMNVPLLVVSGTGLARPLARELTTWVMRNSRATTVLDLDYRPTLWRSAVEYGRAVTLASSEADLIVGNETEVAASGLSAETLVANGKVLIIKRGADGVSIYSSDGTNHVPGTPITVVNGLGSGDAFAAALGYGLLRGESLPVAVPRASLAGALVASRLACASAMPTLSELALARNSLQDDVTRGHEPPEFDYDNVTS